MITCCIRHKYFSQRCLLVLAWHMTSLYQGHGMLQGHHTRRGALEDAGCSMKTWHYKHLS